MVLALARGFPAAPIYTTLYDPDGTFSEFRDLDVRVSPLNNVGFLRRDHRKALPLLAWAASRLKIDADVVVASSSGWAHGFGGDHKTLVYCYSPARWLYQPDVYLPRGASTALRAALKVLTPSLTRWDKRKADMADSYLAISTVIHERIQQTYGRDSTILPAPLSDQLRQVHAEPIEHPFVKEGGYIVCVSRLLPYKNIDKVVAAFRELPEERLVVVGRGPEWDNLTRGLPANVAFLTDLTDSQMRTAYERSAGLVAASFEDYGLTPLEAASAGKPSAVLRAGGFLDTMVEEETAIFFDMPEPMLIAEGVRRMLVRSWSPQAIRAHADRFTEESFIVNIGHHIAELVVEEGS